MFSKKPQNIIEDDVLMTCSNVLTISFLFSHSFIWSSYDSNITPEKKSWTILFDSFNSSELSRLPLVPLQPLIAPGPWCNSWVCLPGMIFNWSPLSGEHLAMQYIRVMNCTMIRGRKVLGLSYYTACSLLCMKHWPTNWHQNYRSYFP